MTPAAIAALSMSMSADAFAASLAKGAALDRPRVIEALRTGAVFGLIEAITPLLGWALGLAASAHAAAVDHWIAFGLLGVIGGRMVLAALRPAPPDAVRPCRHGYLTLVCTAVATSIDAMAIGVSMAFLETNIALVAGAIGLATFAMVTLGMLLGRYVGARLGRWAEAVAGLCLVLIGTNILLEHLTAG